MDFVTLKYQRNFHLTEGVGTRHPQSVLGQSHTWFVNPSIRLSWEKLAPNSIVKPILHPHGMTSLEYQMYNFDTSSLLAAGLALVAIPRGQKAPVEAKWNHRSKAIIKQSDICKLNGMSIGLAHAYCSPTPTCALDIDNYPAAKKWLLTHDIDLDHWLHDQASVVIRSGRKNSI